MNTFQIRSFWKYWLDAVDAHSLHSPFYFDFYEKVIREQGEDFDPVIEKLREKLLTNPTPLLIKDLGAGSVHGRNERTIREIAKTSLSPSKYSRLYARAIKHFGARNIIELGTSLGINTLYLAHNGNSMVATFEGSPAIAAVAKSTFEFANARNIELIEGDLANTLETWLGNHASIDFAFIDANHRLQPTLRYFEALIKHSHAGTVIVLDDIHYSEEMERAWQQLKAHPLVYGTADVWRAGFIFLDPSLNKQDVVLQF